MSSNDFDTNYLCMIAGCTSDEERQLAKDEENDCILFKGINGWKNIYSITSEDEILLSHECIQNEECATNGDVIYLSHIEENIVIEMIRIELATEYSKKDDGEQLLKAVVKEEEETSKDEQQHKKEDDLMQYLITKLEKLNARNIKVITVNLLKSKHGKTIKMSYIFLNRCMKLSGEGIQIW